MTTKIVTRSSITGRFVRPSNAVRYPRTTETQHIRVPSPKDKPTLHQ